MLCKNAEKRKRSGNNEREDGRYGGQGFNKRQRFSSGKKKWNRGNVIKDRIDEKVFEPRRSGFIDKRVKFWVI